MKLINAIKNYPYKLITAGLLLIFSTVAYMIFHVQWLQYISVITFIGLCVWIIIKTFSALENEFKDRKDKTRAYILVSVWIAWFSFLLYLILKFILQ